MKIMISRTDGGVSIMTMVRDGADVAVQLEKWKGIHPGEYASHRVAEDHEVPADRTFRNAWTDAGGKIAHDMPKAKELRKNQLRAERAPLLEALDVEYLRAVEAKDQAKQAAIAAKKQSLRDITADPRITNAQTVTDLLAVNLPTV